VQVRVKSKRTELDKWQNNSLHNSLTALVHTKFIFFPFSNNTPNVGCNDGFFFVLLSQMIFFWWASYRKMSLILYFFLFFSRDLRKEVLVPVVCLPKTIFCEGKLLFQGNLHIFKFCWKVVKFR
jgi:hypothetical protein